MNRRIAGHQLGIQVARRRDEYPVEGVTVFESERRVGVEKQAHSEAFHSVVGSVGSSIVSSDATISSRMHP